MVAGNWLNYDGLYLQYGTSKAIPEAGGDYLMYGESREIEVLVNLGATVYGLPTANVANPALPSSFQGTIASQTALANTGIVSFTTLFPLQPTAPIGMATAGIYTASAGAANGILNIFNPQMYIERVETLTLVAANAGTGGATGILGIGLVTPVSNQSSTPTAPSWAQITPNAGVQILGAINNAQMANGTRYTLWPPVNAIAEYTTPTTAITTYPTAGSWMGNVPLTTLAETYLPGGLPNNAYISAIANGGVFTGSAGGGLIKLRIRYFWYGTINDATQI